MSTSRTVVVIELGVSALLLAQDAIAPGDNLITDRHSAHTSLFGGIGATL